MIVERSLSDAVLGKSFMISKAREKDMLFPATNERMKIVVDLVGLKVKVKVTTKLKLE